MGKLDASAVAAALVEFGQRTALRGGNPYRARAYSRAAENLMALSEPLEDLIGQNRLRDVPGVGQAIADIIVKLHKAGVHPALEAMRKEFPASLLEMLSLPGLRPEKVLKIHNELGVSTLEELELAGREGRLVKVKGLGETLQRKVLQGIDIRRQGRGQRHIHRAAELLAAAERNLKESRLGLRHVTAAGEFRRGCELVSDISLVAQVSARKAAPQVLQPNEQFKVHLTDKDRYGITLLLATGSETHLAELRAIAKRKGYVLDAEGLRRGDRVIASKTEEAIYAALGLPFIAPELREGLDEIKLARAGALPDLVTEKDIRGLLHAHTDSSDGANTLEQMAQATRARGYAYFGVADHSQSAGYAGGLKRDQIEAQHTEVDRLNARYGAAFRLFKGIESDILPDGSLDYPDEILARFDFVVASVHSRFRLDRATQTERIVRAVANPHTTILGHMTGRQLLRRPGYDVDIEQILAACAEHGVAVEINANPWRLDLDWRWHARALELGCRMSINPDAHSIAELDLTRWGVAMARKGGVPRERVLNCLDLPALQKYFAGRRPAISAKSGRPRRTTRPATPRTSLRPVPRPARRAPAKRDG